MRSSRRKHSAYRATAEKHANALELPPVVVTIAASTAYGTVSLRIRDQGGGIPPSDVSRVFTCALAPPLSTRKLFRLRAQMLTLQSTRTETTAMKPVPTAPNKTPAVEQVY